MTWLIRRAALILCFGLGTSLWYLLTRAPSLGSSLPKPPARAALKTPPPLPSDAGPRRARVQDEPLGQTIKFGPTTPVLGSVNKATLVLRHGPDVVERLKIGKYEGAEILEATRDILRVRIAANDGTDDGGVVRERDHEGWTTWDSVIPSGTAIVLDAETGALVARVPLDDGMTSVTFSPDGSRALFFQEGGALAREVRTSDYTHTRTLASPSGEAFSSPFYGPGGALYVAANRQGNRVDGSRVSLVRIGADEGPNPETGIKSDDYEFLAVSPDGSKVFIARGRREGSHEMKVDVYDVRAGRLLNTLTLTGTELPWSADSFVLNADGTELYAQLSEKSDSVSVIDTRTGQRVRELPTPGGGWFHLFRQNLVGESLLLTTWDYESAGAPAPRSFWADGREVIEAGRGILFAVEAAGRRYAVNAEGTRFFQLGAEDNGIAASFRIPRPELLRGGKTDAEDLEVYGLSASPDGKRLIVFVGFVHGC
jgi:hypothetical protein